MTSATLTEQPIVFLPARLLLAAVLLPTLAVGSAWTAAAAALGSGSPYAGLLAAAIVALCTTAGLLAIRPWKPRPAALAITLWLLQTVIRLLATPLLAYLLYSATSLGAAPFFAAVGLAYIAAVLTETCVLTRHLRRLPVP
jgi:hypothetical protein